MRDHVFRVGTVVFVGQYGHSPSDEFFVVGLLDHAGAFEAHNGESFLLDAVEAEVEEQVRGIDGGVFHVDQKIPFLAAGDWALCEHG